LFASTADLDNVLAAERQLLGFLIHASSAADAARGITQRLKAYRFESLEHQVLFECVAGLITHQPGDIQSQLPAQLVRAGFPDFDLRRFLGVPKATAEQAEQLCTSLVRSASP